MYVGISTAKYVLGFPKIILEGHENYNTCKKHSNPIYTKYTPKIIVGTLYFGCSNEV